MPITKNQRLAMGVIIASGLLGGTAVLVSARHQAGASEAEAETGAGQPDPAKHVGGSAHQEAAHVTISPEQQKAAGISVQTAGPSRLQAAAQFQGEIRFNEDRTAHIVPRLAGVAEAVPANLGQRVAKGQVMAVIASTSLSEQRSELMTAQRRREAARATYEREKKLWQQKISAEQDFLQAQTALDEADIAVQNASQKLAAIGAAGSSSSLNRFEIRAPFDGTVVDKHLTLGEAVKEDASIFTVADLNVVWAEFVVAPKDLQAVRVGQHVVVSSTAFEGKSEGVISYVSALLGEQTRTARARVTLANPDGAWRPGLYVTVAVLGSREEVPLALSVDAIQTIESQATAFVAVAGGFAPRTVKVGRSDGISVEVLDGIKAGERYAASGTFVLKADLGKASAEHAD